MRFFELILLFLGYHLIWHKIRETFLWVSCGLILHILAVAGWVGGGRNCLFRVQIFCLNTRDVCVCP